jgi:hypothetical protein
MTRCRLRHVKRGNFVKGAYANTDHSRRKIAPEERRRDPEKKKENIILLICDPLPLDHPLHHPFHHVYERVTSHL